jgi:hypothetical protein
MMQTAKPWHGYDLATRTGITRCNTTGRRSFCQCKMRAILVVVADVLVHQAFQMAFVENDHVIKQIAAAVGGWRRSGG